MDLNGDGHADVLSGCYMRSDLGMPGLFHVLYGDGDAGLRPAEVLNDADGAPLLLSDEPGLPGVSPRMAQSCTRPFAADLDGDGHLDLVVGNTVGTFGVCKGEGRGRFAREASWLRRDGEPLRVDGHSDPFLVDWDGDGDLDLLSGSKAGGVFLFVNEGSRTAPAFGACRALVAPPAEAEVLDGGPVRFGDAHVTGPQRATRVWADDVDGDGDLDLLVGDRLTLVYLQPGVAADAAAAWLEDWHVRVRAAFDESVEADKVDGFPAVLEKMRQEKAAFVTEEATGFVWLLRRR